MELITLSLYGPNKTEVKKYLVMKGFRIQVFCFASPYQRNRVKGIVLTIRIGSSGGITVGGR